MAKSIFSSLGVNSALAAAVVSIGSFILEPTNYNKAADCFRTFGLNEQAAFMSRAGMLIVPVLSIGAAVGRFRKGDLYTPPWMPGPNKAELEQKEVSQATRVERSIDQVIDLSNRVLEVSQVLMPAAKPKPASKPEHNPIPPEDPHDFSAMLQQIESDENSGFLN